MKKLIGLFLILFLSSTVLIAQENRTARRGADMKAMQERMISELKLDEKQAAEYQKISDEFRSKMQSEREKMGGINIDNSFFCLFIRIYSVPFLPVEPPG